MGGQTHVMWAHSILKCYWLVIIKSCERSVLKCDWLVINKSCERHSVLKCDMRMTF